MSSSRTDGLCSIRHEAFSKAPSRVRRRSIRSTLQDEGPSAPCPWLCESADGSLGSPETLSFQYFLPAGRVSPTGEACLDQAFCPPCEGRSGTGRSPYRPALRIVTGQSLSSMRHFTLCLPVRRVTSPRPGSGGVQRKSIGRPTCSDESSPSSHAFSRPTH